MTIVHQSMPIHEENDNFYSCMGEIEPNSIQIPIIGYEIMEERARFTVCLSLCCNIDYNDNHGKHKITDLGRGESRKN